MEFEDRDTRKTKGVKEELEESVDQAGADLASESGGSSTEEYAGDSPKSVVGKWRMNKIGVVHSQVLKIREEDSHLGEDIIVNLINGGGSGNNSAGQNAQLRFVSSAVDVMLSSRLILPSSPLGGNTAVKASQ